MKNLRRCIPLFALFLVLLSNNQPSEAQRLGDWQNYVSHADARLLSLTPDNHIWAATGGGMIEIQDSEIIREYTVGSGLYRVNATAMSYDEGNDYIWRGFDDGTLERVSLSSGSIVQYGDIRRSDRFSSRAVNALQIIDERLYVATDFGIIVFDPQTGLVRDQFTNLGDFNSGLPVNDITVYNEHLLAATPAGIAIGNLDDELDIPSRWDNFDEEDGLPDENFNLITNWQNRVLTSSSAGIFSYDNDSWQETDYFQGKNVSSMTISNQGNAITATSADTVFIRDDDGEEFFLPFEEFDGDVESVINDSQYMEEGSQIFLATDDFGNLQINRQTGEIEREIILDGPFSNFFTDMNMDGSTLISASRNTIGRTGFYIFSDGEWRNYHRDSNEYLGDNNIRRIMWSGVGEQAYYFGSFGQGLVRLDKDTEEIRHYDNRNSPIQDFEPGENFTVLGGIASGWEGNMWVASWTNQQDAIYEYEESEGEFEVYSRPANFVGDTRFFGLMRDSGGRLWSSLTDDGFSGRGLAVMQPDEDGVLEGAHLTEDGASGNLPNEMVNDITEDQRGEVYIATNGGVASFPFPDRIIQGGVQDRQASLLLNADTTATSPFLLNNVHANAIEVNAANQKWIGTETAGLWLISPVGGRYEVLEHFTADNSPLISDNIISLTLDEETGTLYIATDTGLMSYVGTTKAGVEEMDDLFVYPNPYSYSEEDGNIIIEGFSDATKLNILTADGRVVDRLDTQGGRIEWNARDFQGNRLGSGVYVLVAVDEDNGERGTGKVVIIR